ncbi:hypothetical protein Lgee_1431 [Legionella geestiana]|uniref:Uncharacterized protein n=1 Tax=Legionella geestiana TaxID=45065 RepID=A0A0W0TTL2_9GAMM|nr:hypothetical protein [Legionella geestiana]KTC98854.1 hypothetical protein Lgee_1431 [Legionella geestiana]QBS12755.1 hypothetical protein E4T54_08360 [Legionella geestiana]STX54772.1 Uncharacterised protein [Legionella geestiana]
MKTCKVVVLDLGVKGFHHILSWYLHNRANALPEPTHSVAIYQNRDIRQGLNLEFWLVPSHRRLECMREVLLQDASAVILVSGSVRASEVNLLLDRVCRSLPPGLSPWRACVEGVAPRGAARIRAVNLDNGAGIEQLMQEVVSNVPHESLQKRDIKERLRAWIRYAEGDGQTPDYTLGFSFLGRWQAVGRRRNCLTAKKLLLELESPNAQLQQVLARASQIRATIEPGLCFFSRRITSDTLNRIIEDGLQPPAP